MQMICKLYQYPLCVYHTHIASERQSDFIADDYPCHVLTYIPTNKHINRKADRLGKRTKIQPDEQTYIYIQTYKQTDRHTDVETDTYKHT